MNGDALRIAMMTLPHIFSQKLPSLLIMVSAFVEEKLKLAFSVLGGVVLLSFVLTFLKGIYARILRGGKNLKLTYGTWGS